MSEVCPFCGELHCFPLGTGRSYECYETELAALRTQLTETQALLREAVDALDLVKSKSVSEEWPDCGKPYWCCELCGESTDKGQGVEFLKHEGNCPILVIQAFLTTPAIRALEKE